MTVFSWANVRFTVLRVCCVAACLVGGGFVVGFAADPKANVSDANGGEYRLIQPQHFEMGSDSWASFRKDHLNRPVDDARTKVAVILTQPFYVATTEVTVGQFRRFVDATQYRTTAETRIDAPENGESKSSDLPPGVLGWKPVDDDRGRPQTNFAVQPEFSWRDPGFMQDDSHPVVGVSFEDARAYCRWLTDQSDGQYRLPTEAEWEAACRAGTTTHFSFGDQYKHIFHQHANFADADLEASAPGRGVMQWLFDPDQDPGDGHAFTAPVASYLANPWGLHDMHGNVWEWCEDTYLDTRYQQFKQPSHGQPRPRAIDPVCTEAWNEHGDWRVIRGGSWYLPPLQCRSSTRGVFNAGDAACYVGFRVVREADAELRDQARDEHTRSEAALESLTSIARQVREYDDGVMRLEFTAEQLADDLLTNLAALQYRVDVTIRPPGVISSQTIGRFKSIPHLHGFGLATTCEDLDSDTFEMLADHPGLRRLQLTGNVKLADDQVFPYLAHSKLLTELHLQGEGITDAGLMSLPKLRSLRSLKVDDTAVSGMSLDHFRGSPLEDLAVAGLTDETAGLLAEYPTLRSLDCSGSVLGRSGLKRIAELPRLRSLTLCECGGLQDDDFESLAGSGLERLDLRKTAAGDRAAVALADVLYLRDLRIGSPTLTDEGVRQLCQVVSLHQLTIDDRSDRVTDEGFVDLWRLVNLRHLTIGASEVAGRFAGPLSELPEVQHVVFQGTKVRAEVLSELRGQLPDAKVEAK